MYILLLINVSDQFSTGPWRWPTALECESCHTFSRPSSSPSSSTFPSSWRHDMNMNTSRHRTQRTRTRRSSAATMSPISGIVILMRHVNTSRLMSNVHLIRLKQHFFVCITKWSFCLQRSFTLLERQWSKKLSLNIIWLLSSMSESCTV